MGVDQAGAGPVARDRVVQRVTDLPCSAGVVCGNSIHIEEAENLTNVLIQNNDVQHAIAASGVRNLTIAHNIVVSSNVWSDGAPAGKHVCDCCQYGVMGMCQNITIGQ